MLRCLRYEKAASKEVYSPRCSQLLGLSAVLRDFMLFSPTNLLSDREIRRSLLILLRSESADRCFRVLAYCVMPDHLHFLVEETDARSDLLHFMKSFKI